MSTPRNIDTRCLKVKEVACYLRVSTDKVRRWIYTGELRAFNTADKGKKVRYVVSLDAIAEFEAVRAVAKPQPRPRRLKVKDYYPD